MKRAIAVFSALLMAAAMTACGPQSSPQAPASSGSPQAAPSSAPEAAPPASSAEPLRITWWGTQYVHEYTLQVCDQFTQETGIPMQAEYAAWSDYWQKLSTLSAAGDLPDLIRQDYAYIDQYASKNLLEPLDGYVESGAINCADVDPLLISGGIIDGKLYGVNIGSNSMCMAYNKELIAQAGMEEPGPGMSWQDYENFCTEFAQKTGKYGGTIYELCGSTDVVQFVFRAAGQSMYDNENLTLGYDDDGLLVGFLDSVKRMQEAKAIPNIDSVAQQKSVEDSVFTKGEAATICIWSDIYPTLEKVMGKELGITVIPGTGATKAMYLNPSQFHSISATSTRKDDAAKFIDLWTNDVEINKILLGRRGVPISSKVADAISGDLDDTGKRVFAYMADLANYSSPIDPPDPSGASEVGAELKKQFELTLFGENDSAQSAAAFRKNANEYLKAANQ